MKKAPKQKKCKGTGKAINYGCGKETNKRIYGLCMECYPEWLYNTPEGSELIKRRTIKAKNERQKKQRVLKKSLQPGTKILSNAMRLADDYFSQYIRLKHSFELDGKICCRCITSNEIKYIKDIDNGHYISRTHKSTRYDEDNCRPQRKHDNQYRSGMHKEFEEALINEIGQSRVNRLKEKSKEIINADLQFYLGKAKEYRMKRNEILEKMLLKWSEI